MNQDQVMGMLRIFVPAVLSYAVGKGWLTSSQVADFTAAVITIGGIGWSIFVHTDHNKIASVAAMPEVKNVVTTPEIANAIPDNKVTATPIMTSTTKP